MKITVLRDKKKQDFTVNIQDRKEVLIAEGQGLERSGSSETEKGEATPAKFGIAIENLTPARKEALGFKEKGGVLVAQVNPGSFAEDVGLVENDILVAINRQPVESADDVKRIQSTLKPGDPVVFHVTRSDVPIAGRRGTQAGHTPQWTGLFFAGTMPNTP